MQNTLFTSYLFISFFRRFTMKSNVRKLAAILLAAALILAPLTLAFGYSTGDLIKWKYKFTKGSAEETVDNAYTYLGTAKTGKQTISGFYSGLAFTPKSSGFYIIVVTPGDDDESWVQWDVSESFNKDGAFNSKVPDSIYLYRNTGTADEPNYVFYGICAYFKAGSSSFIGVDEYNSENGKVTVEIKKSGAPVSVQAPYANKTYLIGYDIDQYLTGNYVEIYDGMMKVRFSNGETYCTDDIQLRGNLKTGTCNITATFGPDSFKNYKFNVKIKCVDVKDCISKVEYIGNIDGAVKYYYNGIGTAKDGITDIKVTYKNGKTETFPVFPSMGDFDSNYVLYYTYITIGDNEVFSRIFVGKDVLNDNCYLVTDICGTLFGKTKVNVDEANLFENIGKFNEKANSYLNSIYFNFYDGTNLFEALSNINYEFNWLCSDIFAIPLYNYEY
jgi:hypothetical protein